MPEIQATQLLDDLLTNEWEIAVLEGSSRSSKTYTILQWLILQALQRPGITIRGYRNDQTTIAKTVVPDFQAIMRFHFRCWDSDAWNKQEKKYTFPNGTIITFDGTMDTSKLHGLRQDIAWLNEVMEITLDAWRQIEMRTTGQVLMDFNPSISSHWVFTTILTRDSGVYYQHSTYRDNPFLSARQIQAIERLEPSPANQRQGTANEWAWRVYGKGERAGREGRIYTNYRQTDHWPDPMLCIRHGFGLDFGFSNDPSAVVECALFQDELYLRLHVYETGLLTVKPTTRATTPSIEGRMEESGIDRNQLIIADCARPDSIAELQSAGYNLAPCVKGKDSIVNGIQTLQGFTLVVHRQSQAIIEELENYTWKKHNATGQWLDEPIDDFNHALDATRYWAMSNLSARQIRPQAVRIAHLPTHAEPDGALV